MRKYLYPASIVALAWTAFQLYTAAFGFLPALQQRAIHVAFAISLAFLVFQASNRLTNDQNSKDSASSATRTKASSLVLSALALGSGLYLASNYERLISRVPIVDELSIWDLICGTVLLGLLLEATRRAMGWTLPIIGLAFLAYQVFGVYIPGQWGHSGTSFEHLVEYQTLGVQGIFGTPIGVVGNVVFYFVLFAAFMKASGTGELFNDVAVRLTGKYSGGPAKAAVASSGAMGMLSGSAVGNVASTGVFTIPLMKKSGFSGRIAGAVESVASTGGQMLPPLMGAAAFIMAEFMGRPYLDIIIAALIPAILYYLAVFLTVHFYAKRHGAARIKSDDLPGWKSIAQRAHLLIPLIVLIGLIAQNYTLQTAALWAIGASILVPYLRRDTRVNPLSFIDGSIDGARQAIVVALPAAAAGIIVGTVSYSGLGVNLSSLLIEAGGGIYILTILLVGFGCMVLGAGMPTTGAYITAAILLAPALIELGVPAMAAHMFVLYLCVMSMITPPVALASYAAASISGESGLKTGVTSFRIGIAGFLIPLAFVLEPAILLGDAFSPSLTPLSIGLVILGVASIAAANAQFLIHRNTLWETLLLVFSGLLLIYPEIVSGAAGALLLVFVFAKQYPRRRREGSENIDKDLGLPDELKDNHVSASDAR